MNKPDKCYFTSANLTKSHHYEDFSRTREEKCQENAMTGPRKFVKVPINVIKIS